MFTTSQLIKIFSKSKKSDEPQDTVAVADIIEHVGVESGIADNHMDYFCKIDLLELSKSDMPEEQVFEMAENGWVLSKDRKSLLFYY